MRKRVLLAVLFVFIFAASSAGAQNLTWTAGNVGGGWYTIGGGIANIINEKSGGITVKVIPGGGVQNPSLVDKGDCELGWGLPFMNAAAWNGEDPYNRKAREPPGHCRGDEPEFLPFLFGRGKFLTKPWTKSSGRKRRSGSPCPPPAPRMNGSSGRSWPITKPITRPSEAAGFKFFRGSYAEQASQFKDRNVDSVFTFLAVPAAAVTEASVGRSLRIMNFPPALLESLASTGSGVERSSRELIPRPPMPAKK